MLDVSNSRHFRPPFHCSTKKDNSLFPLLKHAKYGSSFCLEWQNLGETSFLLTTQAKEYAQTKVNDPRKKNVLEKIYLKREKFLRSASPLPPSLLAALRDQCQGADQNWIANRSPAKLPLNAFTVVFPPAKNIIPKCNFISTFYCFFFRSKFRPPIKICFCSSIGHCSLRVWMCFYVFQMHIYAL